MNQTHEAIWNEYETALRFKNSIGRRGLAEQGRINERFFIGDQWHGAKCGKERPLVRHNIIKRIGEYKMSQILSDPVSVSFRAEGIGTNGNDPADKATGETLVKLTKHFAATSERLKWQSLNEQILRKAYVSGTGALYTYWDPEYKTGLFADREKKTPIRGDIACEVLNIEDIYFADPYITDLQKQPYIILKTVAQTADIAAKAGRYGASEPDLRSLYEESVHGKITVLTKLFKEYKNDGSYTIKSVTVTEHTVVRKTFDTGLTLYPLAIFSWERRAGLIYGESEITHLIPNQIAINRMLTANVWGAMTSGMPMMVINGDLVPNGITNEPGQIVKVYGGKEEVEGAIRYIAPPDFSANLSENTEALIRNTLTQSGANEVALGDSTPQNASALMTMRNAAIMPLKIVKSRFYTFAEEVAAIWLDFWLHYYGTRAIPLKEKNGSVFAPFCMEEYQGLTIRPYAAAGGAQGYSDRESYEILTDLFVKGVITKAQLMERIPESMIASKEQLLAEIYKEEERHDGV